MNTHELSIRPATPEDLNVFFVNQTDEEANFMAAFTPENPHDRDAYIAKWTRLLDNPTVNAFAICIDDEAKGCVIKFEIEGDAEITYAIDKTLWGKGYTTKAVQAFLTIETHRPIHGRVAFDNTASQHILAASGFKEIGREVNYANARKAEIEEVIFRLG